MTALDTRPNNRSTPSDRPLVHLAAFWAAGTGLAILLVGAAYLVGQEFADPFVVTGAGEVTLGNVTGFTVLGATIGAALALVMGRFTRRPRPTFLVVTLIALAGYAIVPFTAAESLQTALWLNIFHVVVAVPVIGILSRSLPAGRAQAEA